MEIIPNRVDVYRTIDGRAPFEEWLGSIKDRKTVAVVEKRMNLLRRGSLGDFKFFEGIYELRIDYGPGYRIYCGKKDQTFILLILGGSKGSQRQDVERAVAYWEDFRKRFPT